MVAVSKWLTDRATIRRWDSDSDESDGDDDDSNIWSGSSSSSDEPAELETVAEGVPCLFDDSSTSFVREETGERVSTPATATFLASSKIEEGDVLEIDGMIGQFEVRGLDQERDHLRGTAPTVEAELARYD